MRLATLVLLVAIAWAWPTAASAKVTLVLGLYPSEKPRNLVQALRPSLDALEDLLAARLEDEVEVRTQVFSDYQTTLDRFLAQEVDFARLGPASYVMGKSRDPAIALLAMENDRGSIAFEGVIVTHADSPVASLADLAGRSFAFGAERSTLGRYFAQAYLAEAGIRAEDLSHYNYLGHHEAVGLAVGAGRYDAGALNIAHVRQAARPRHAAARDLPLSTTSPAPGSPAPGLDAGAWWPPCAGPCSTSTTDNASEIAWVLTAFLPGKDAHFDRTRQILAETDVILATAAIEN